MIVLRAALLVTLCVGGSLAQSSLADRPLATAKRGLIGELTFTFEGARLRARPQLDLSAPILLRLERDATRESVYVARFLGSIEGDYDLRALIGRADGGHVEDLPPLPVRVVSSLDDQLSTDLYDAADLEVEFVGRYRRLAWLAAIAWVLVPVVVLLRRFLRRAPVETDPEPVAAPTLADQLRPLCEAAQERELTVAEQGRLELLLYHIWRERLGLHESDVASAVHRVRHDPEAGALLHAVERWLHLPDRTGLDPAELDQLLAPYRARPAVPESSLGRGAPSPAVVAEGAAR